MFDALGYTGGLRRGYTTGSCAAAAARGAIGMLLFGTASEYAEIVLPGGEKLRLRLESCSAGDGAARCAVRKESGDDPDSTDGILIFAEVRLTDREGIGISGGEGIGRVTRKGLPVRPGEWAINPVPRKMIREAILSVLPEGRGASVVISAPEGTALAAKTWNPRLGVEGGISILGTTGIVEPKSTAAYLASIDIAISAALAFDSSCPGTVFLVPGYVGEKPLVEVFGAPRELIVRIGDHVGHALRRCAELNVPRLHLFGHVGKWAKVAAGLFNTHCDFGDARLETIAACAGAAGAMREQIRTLLSLPLAEEAVEPVLRWGLGETFAIVAERAHRRASLLMGGTVPLGVAVLSLEGAILGGFPEIREGVTKWEDLPSSA
jgi:cobalt-precorrin-5B (C1)-methyltransferase